MEADAAILIRRAAVLFVVGIIATGCGGDHAGQGREFGDAAVYVTVAVSDEVLRLDPDHAERIAEMEDKLYSMMDELGGLEIPLNPPRGRSQNIRLRGRGGKEAADFPNQLVVPEPVNRNAQ